VKRLSKDELPKLEYGLPFETRCYDAGARAGADKQYEADLASIDVVMIADKIRSKVLITPQKADELAQAIDRLIRGGQGADKTESACMNRTDPGDKNDKV